MSRVISLVYFLHVSQALLVNVIEMLANLSGLLNWDDSVYKSNSGIFGRVNGQSLAPVRCEIVITCDETSSSHLQPASKRQV